MDTSTGEIRTSEDNKSKPGEILISQLEKQYLEMFKADERLEVLTQLRSKNNSARRRARKRIEKESRRRNHK